MKVSRADENAPCLHERRFGYMAPDQYEHEDRQVGMRRLGSTGGFHNGQHLRSRHICIRYKKEAIV